MDPSSLKFSKGITRIAEFRKMYETLLEENESLETNVKKLIEQNKRLNLDKKELEHELNQSKLNIALIEKQRDELLLQIEYLGSYAIRPKPSTSSESINDQCIPSPNPPTGNATATQASSPARNVDNEPDVRGNTMETIDGNCNIDGAHREWYGYTDFTEEESEPANVAMQPSSSYRKVKASVKKKKNSVKEKRSGRIRRVSCVDESSTMTFQIKDESRENPNFSLSVHNSFLEGSSNYQRNSDFSTSQSRNVQVLLPILQWPVKEEPENNADAASTSTGHNVGVSSPYGLRKRNKTRDRDWFSKTYDSSTNKTKKSKADVSAVPSFKTPQKKSSTSQNDETGGSRNPEGSPIVTKNKPKESPSSTISNLPTTSSSSSTDKSPVAVRSRSKNFGKLHNILERVETENTNEDRSLNRSSLSTNPRRTSKASSSLTDRAARHNIFPSNERTSTVHSLLDYPALPPPSWINSECKECKICEKFSRRMTFKSRELLDQHIWTNHPNPFPDYLRCPVNNCQRHFESRVQLSHHAELFHMK